MHRLPVFVLALFLSTGWLSDAVRATATALGLESLTAADKPSPAPPPTATTDSGSEWDPLGQPRP